MADPKTDVSSPLSETLSMAFSGDPVMLRNLAGTLGAFSVRILVAAAIFAFTIWAAKRLAKGAERALAKVHNRNHPADNTLPAFVGAIVKYLVIAIGLIAVLQQLGVQAASVIAVLGAASLAVGLALQGTLSNVAAGVMIMLQRPYRVGDKVELNGKQGTVSSMDLFNTKLLDYDGMTIYVPNGKVFGDMIVNITQLGRRRIDLTFGVDYDDDLDLALKLLTDIAKADDRVMADPAPWARVTALGDSAVNVSLRCWTHPDVWMNTKFDIMKRVKETFEAEGLSFPYPHQVAVEKAPKAEGPERNLAAGQPASH